MTLAAVTLDDKYTAEHGRVFLTGVQALVRLPLMQRQRDLAAGLNTAGFISGYRGSPLAAYDLQLWRAKKFLEKQHIVFKPGVNEDMAATAVWGTQQVGLGPKPKYDGVFGIWYGKGPGVDRCGDVIRHANSAGSARHGGVLVICGDDHNAVSSTVAHQSEHNLASWMVPMLYPAGVQEYLDYGLLGWAMSRYSGCWVGFKAVTELVESAASVDVAPDRLDIRYPEFQMPEGGLNIRWPDNRWDEEIRLQRYKVYAALAFARENGINRIVVNPPRARFGIVSTGKSYLDVRQALDDLGLDAAALERFGIRLLKIGMPWPLEPQIVREFATGLDEVLVVEEKRAMIENQLKEQLYNWREDVRPRVVGKFDENRQWLLPSHGELSPATVAKVIHARIKDFASTPRMAERIAELARKEAAAKESGAAPMVRTPYFCSGCPHNTSTKVPEGSRALAGIGCHFMALWMNRSTETFTQMGGEGVPWVGQAPFTDEHHIFANLGDGTYYHSGLMAIRAAIAGQVNITYKILFNDAVAMTGGQPHDGPLTVPQIAQQVHHEGVTTIAVVSDEPDKYPLGTQWPDGTTIHHRDELETVQTRLRDTAGCTVLIYDQTCAAEKRRRRKRGTFPDPDRRVFINEAVCEGCGDCSVQSNCVSVEPLETEFGRKRQINQSSCNKDFSCVKGFCPSFVSVRGATIRKADTSKGKALDTANLPLPEIASTDGPYNILVTGVGGTGVITIGQLLGMAAHLEGKGVTVLDFTGLAQKNGAVLSHIRIGETAEIHTPRIADGAADLLLGCDMVVAAGDEAIGKIQPGATHAVVNDHLTPTADFTLNPDTPFQGEALRRQIRRAAGDNLTDFVDASRLATALMGDAIATNLFMLGYAFQRGLLPVSAEAIDKAIELNGVAVESNRQTFALGRLAAHDREAVVQAARPKVTPLPVAADPAAKLDRRVKVLTAYQDGAYAARYCTAVEKAEAAERQKTPGMAGLAEAVIDNLFKLMAYKDEYEVARLYTDPAFMTRLREQFDGAFRLSFHLAPPLVAPRDPATGQLQKREFGPWMFTAFKLLARLKGLRGTKLDIFGYTAERKAERALIEEYLSTLDELVAGLAPDNHALAVEIAGLPASIRGFGHIKERNMKAAAARREHLIKLWRNPAERATAAE
jgi:indolepyruvate ferredoxin oxidoreductase